MTLSAPVAALVLCSIPRLGAGHRYLLAVWVRVRVGGAVSFLGAYWGVVGGCLVPGGVVGVSRMVHGCFWLHLVCLVVVSLEDRKAIEGYQVVGFWAVVATVGIWGTWEPWGVVGVS